jgi:hypothetical protein
MSKKLFLFSALLFGMTIALVPACNGDKCPDTCGNGICLEDGACDCDPGYEYDTDGICNVLTQSKFVGVYTASENCVTGPYLVEIVANTDVTKVGIKSFWKLFQNQVIATVDGTTLTIARQEPDNDNFFVEGSGTLSTNTAGKTVISLNYTVKDEDPAGPSTTSCTTTYTAN